VREEILANDAYQTLVVLFGTIVVAYLAIIILIATLRKALWLFSGIFFLLDEFMWFAYNPFRGLMKDKEATTNRVGYYASTMLLVKPLWQIGVWVLTTPLRFVTALYFDVIVYLFVSISDSVEELLHPKLGKMRHRKGMAYWSRWLMGIPFRAGWLLYKNALAVVDSLMMFVISLVWPTFTMYHGTSPNAVYDITQKGRWLVGRGNWGGSGIYFGRSPKVAAHYSGQNGGNHHLIVARVTFTMLRNCGTLREHHRDKVGSMGSAGVDLAQSIKFPFFATELWRQDKNWWEYCLLRGDAVGQFVSSWRIRPIGFVKTKGNSTLNGSLERLWGGQSHYCLSGTNVVIFAASLAVLVSCWSQFFGF
jgi:hypothetical protein